MTSRAKLACRPERISQQPSSADQRPRHSSVRRHSPTRSGREALLNFLLFVVVALLMVWAAHSRLGSSLPEVTTVAVHIVTPECVSAEDMARRYGWEGDWREYMMAVKELNGWERCPILHVGDPVFVPDFRTREVVPHGSVGGPTRQSHRRRAEACPAVADDHAAAGSTYKNSSAVDSLNQQLDRVSPRSGETGRPVGAEILPASPPIAERQIRGRRQGRAARTIFHGGNHDSTAATPNSATDR